MTETMNPPRTTTKGGGLGTTKGTELPRPAGAGDDFNRLAQMLERIRKTLESLVNLKPVIVPKVLSDRFIKTWPEAEASLLDAIVIVMDETKHGELLPKLQAVGLTDAMLEMKEESLNFYLNQVDKEVLTYSKKKGKFERLVKWIKPGCKVINSILGSLLTAIPGLHVGKEFKEHVEAAYEVAATAAESNK